MRMENLTFGPALQLLAERANISCRSFNYRRIGKKEGRKGTTLPDQCFCHCLLPEDSLETKTGEKAVAYLEARGISALLQRIFPWLCAAPVDRFGWTISQKGISLNEAEKAGLVCGGGWFL